MIRGPAFATLLVSERIPFRNETEAHVRIGASGKTALGPAFRSRTVASVKQSDEHEPAQTGTNLVLAEARKALRQDQHPSNRPLAAFLTQLIAKAQDVPSTRTKCRIDPAEGTRIYRDVSAIR